MERSRHSITETIIQEVALVTNTDPLALPPLYQTIDPEALEAAIDKLSEGRVSFDYLGHQVTVESDGTVQVAEPSTDGLAQREPATDD